MKRISLVAIMCLVLSCAGSVYAQGIPNFGGPLVPNGGSSGGGGGATTSVFSTNAINYAGTSIATLGSITGGSSYTTGTAIFTLGAITGGSAYTPGSYTNVALTGGAGSGATANIIVNTAGAVASVTLAGVGTGYVGGDTLSAAAANIGGTGSGFSIPVSTVGYYNVPVTGGAGTLAAANIVVSGGAVTAVTLTNNGSGYGVGNTLSVSAASIGGTGSGFSVPVATIGSSGLTSSSTIFYWNGSATGSCISNCTMNYWAVNDTIASLSSNTKAFMINHNIGAGATGGRTTLDVTMNITATPGDVNKNYQTTLFVAQSSANLGGSSGSYAGGVFGPNPNCRLVNGATFINQLVCQEIDLAIGLGASANDLIGQQVVVTSNHANAAALQNAAYIAGAQSPTTPTLSALLQDGARLGYPVLGSTGWIFKCYPHLNAGNCGALGGGFDLSNYSSLVGNVITGPASNGFIDGSFNISANNVPPGNGSLVINGDMTIDQINEGVASGAGGIKIDRWRNTSGAGANRTTQQVCNDAPVGYQCSLKYTNGTAVVPTTGQQTYEYTQLESTAFSGFGWGAAGGKPVMFDFCAKSSLTGTFSIGLQNAVAARSYVVNYVISAANTWTCFSNSIVADTLGTWTVAAGTMGLFVKVDLGSGSTFNTTAGSWQSGNFVNTASSVCVTCTTGATLQISAVHIYQSTVKMAYTPNPYEVELARAKRFYQKSFSPGTVAAQNVGANTGELQTATSLSITGTVRFPSVILPAQMETVPAVTFYNPSAANANIRDETAAADGGAATSANVTARGFSVSGTAAGTGAVNDNYGIHWSVDTGT